MKIHTSLSQNGKHHKFFAVASLIAVQICGAGALFAQAGGGGAAGAGSGAGAAGPGAAAAAHGASTAAQSPATQTPGTAQAGANGQSAATTYAAGASLGPDPRKPPASRLGALTLFQVVELARARNPTLLAAEQLLRSVRAQELQAGVRANPFFTLYGTNVTLPAAGASNPYAYSAQVSRLFERGEKRRYRLEDTRAITAQTQAQLGDSSRQTVLAVKQAFTRMLIAKDALELSSASLKDFRHEVEISAERYKAGDLGKLDYERLDLQLGNLESDEANNMVTLRQASDQLQTLVGIEIPSPDFDVAGDIIPPVISQTQAQLVQEGLAKRPDYAAARFGVTAAVANARLAMANGTTDPTLEGEYDRSGRYDSAGFSINIPLRIFDRNQGNKRATQLQTEATRFTEIATRNQVISDIDQAWVGYALAKRLSDRFGEHYLDESRDVLSIAQFAFEHGGIALIDYLDALREARSATGNALNAYLQTWQSIHQLSAASATELLP